MGGDNRRGAERLELIGNGQGEVMMAAPIEIRDIGVLGIQIETRYALPLGALHEFRLALDADHVVVKGRIVHSRLVEADRDAVRYRSGVEFVDPTAHVIAAIAAYVEQTARARRGVSVSDDTP